MKTKSIFPLLLSISLIISGCQKLPDLDYRMLPVTESTLQVANNKILVDASKDGGGWWFPQGSSNGYSPSLPHQGKALADYLRKLGFTVDELPRGALITTALLQAYNKVIRAPAFFNYSSGELDAYKQFLQKPSSLLLINDHMQNTSNDYLSQHLGVEFGGVAYGTIKRLDVHAITNGVASIPYNAGCAIINKNKSNLIVLGSLGANEYVDINKNGTYDNGDIMSPPVMGISIHPTAKIFFLGDVNGLETVPQPFTDNLIKWLFN